MNSSFLFFQVIDHLANHSVLHVAPFKADRSDADTDLNFSGGGGFLPVYSAAHASTRIFTTQALGITAGCVVMAVVSKIDYRDTAKVWKWIAVFSVLLQSAMPVFPCRHRQDRGLLEPAAAYLAIVLNPGHFWPSF